MPVGNSFLNLFGQSPIKPLQSHIMKAHNCSEQLLPFLEAILIEDWEKAVEIQQAISMLEREADQIKREIRLNLPKSLFLPVPRGDLLELLAAQDKIANRAKDIAGLMLGRKMQIPESIQKEIKFYLKSSIATSEQALRAIEELDELVETGFSGHEARIVEKMIDDLDRLEHETDILERNLRSSLYNIEKSLYAVDVIFLYKIIDDIGELADQAQKVGNRLELLLAR